MSTHDSAMNSENAAKQASGVASVSPPRLGDLPSPLREVIATVCKRARLWTHERADVEAELAAHFHDGLAQGGTPEKLLADFGDPGAAAKLIRRGKFRNRPLWWRVQRRIGHVLTCVLAVLVGLACIHTVRFYTGQPTLAFRPLEIVNQDATKVPESERGWPQYRAAYLALDLTRDEFRAINDLEVSPNPSTGAAARSALARNTETLARLRDAAAKPALGYLASITGDPELAAKTATLSGGAPPATPDVAPHAENPGAMLIQLSHLGPLRSCARLLRADAIDAMHDGDAPRLHANLAAILSIARQLRTPDTYISALVSGAVIALASDLTRDVLHARPALLTDQQLADLAHRFAALGDPSDIISLQGERLFFRDSLQRLYTDDGDGNGRLTAAGASYFHQTSSHTADTNSLGMLFASALLADRKQMSEAYESIVARAEAAIAIPPWKPVTESADRVLDRYTSTALRRVQYTPIAAYVPPLDRARFMAHEIAQSRDATLTSIALEVHRRRHAAFPVSLAELVPALLPSLPLDNADGRPLRYKPSGDSYLLYSIGSDRVDHQGTRPANQADATAIRRFGQSGEVSSPCDLIFFPRRAVERVGSAAN